MIYQLLRPLLFLLPAEIAHHFTLSLVGFIPAWFFPKRIMQPVKLCGLEFVNPVGSAAGLDNNGDYIDALVKLGFGFIEVGGVTPDPQIGNPQPRIFRLVKQQALINRMGFANKGVDYLVERLKRCKYNGVIGVNICKNKTTPLKNSAQDYIICIKKLYPYASYIVINISSPNTPELRQLQFDHYLENLLKQIVFAKAALQEKHQRSVPLFVKVAPDLTEDEIKNFARALEKYAIDGVIATNTTIDRSNVTDSSYANERGGLSGAPLKEQASLVLKLFRKYLPKNRVIIALGGIMSADDAKERFDSGAQLVELYTGLIYRGPKLVAEIVKSIS